jgi:capsular exopolysaccharide synthesis family protein
MTRLNEALRRARLINGNSETAELPPASDGARRAGALPLAWGFDNWDIDVSGDAAKRDAGRVRSQMSIAAPTRHVERDDSRVSYVASHDASDAVRVRSDFNPPTINPAEAQKLAVGPHADPTLVEQSRRLAAALHHAQLENGTRTMMVASAVEGEGKTLTATNLALTLSHSYQRRVLLVDADLRRPSIHLLFQLSNRTGLGDVLRQPAQDGSLPVEQVSATLWVMTAGRPDPDPMGGLVSDTMKQFLIEAAEKFDWIVIDTPPVAFLPDANLLAAMVDTAILVVSASTTPYPLVIRAIEAIGRSRILGVVLNRADKSEASVGYGYRSPSYARTDPAPGGHGAPFAPRQTG